jgi:hypothetical protein
MTHNEKITRLPREIREQLNRRLRDGEPGVRLLDWLNSLPEVRTAQSPECGGNLVSEQDLTGWQASGYCNWLSQQAVLEQVRQMSADVAELEQAGEGALTNKLAQFLSAQYVVAAKDAVQKAAGGAVDLKTLQMLCGDLVALRRGDQNAEWLRIEREKLDEARKSAQQKSLEYVLDICKKWPDVMDLFRTAYAQFEKREKGGL